MLSTPENSKIPFAPASQPLTARSAIRLLLDGKSLSTPQMESVVTEIMRGESPPALIASLLVLLRRNGETEDEILGAVRAIRANAEPFTLTDKNAIDTCGTGGDSAGTFNISTVAALIAVSAGATVAKHGSRSVSSQCGSADLLEALGFRIELPRETTEKLLDETHFAFLYAPLYHKAMKYVAPVRKELGIRTVFNMLGPLTNPAGVRRQVIGVYERGLTGILAQVLRELEAEHCVVLHGETSEGKLLDEASLCGITHVSELKDGIINNFKLYPEDFGFRRCKLEELAGGTREENARIIWSIIDGTAPAPKRDAALYSAGIACYVAGLGAEPNATIESGIARARAALESGDAKRTLESLIARHSKL